jgi:hypothetical protein
MFLYGFERRSTQESIKWFVGKEWHVFDLLVTVLEHPDEPGAGSIITPFRMLSTQPLSRKRETIEMQKRIK